MKRRDFLKAAVGGISLLFLGRTALLSEPDEYEVGIVQSQDYEKAVIEAINLVGGIEKYVKPGDVVVVKPNIAWNSPPHLKANTDPLIVRTIVDMCYRALASKVYVFDRACNNPKLTYITSGIKKAAEEAGAKVLYVNKITAKLYPSIKIKNATFLKSTTVNRYVLECDTFINVPVAKHHSSAGLTIGMKNLMGITGDNRSKWHWNLHEAISDINIAVRSHLTVVDATNIMIMGGPTGGKPEYLKKLDAVIASSNVASADAEATYLFGKTPESIGYIRLAREKNIGKIRNYSKKKITV